MGKTIIKKVLNGYDDSVFVRVRMNRSEVQGILELLDKTNPQVISDFHGERQGLATFRAKLTSAYKLLNK